MCNWISNETFRNIWIGCLILLSSLHFISGMLDMEKERFIGKIVNIGIFASMAFFMVVFAINGIICG